MPQLPTKLTTLPPIKGFVQRLIQCSYADEFVHEQARDKIEQVLVEKWENPAKNDFLLVSQFSVTGALYTCQPDLVSLVNGLSLVVIELKKPGTGAGMANDEFRLSN